LKRLGKVSHISSHRKLILRSEFAPKIGDVVVTKDLTEIGKISDVFGPVSRPYIAVKPNENSSLDSLVGQPLYVLPSFKKPRKAHSRRKMRGRKG